MVDAWGGWSLFQELLQTLKRVASKHSVSIPTVAVRYILDQVNFFFLQLNDRFSSSIKFQFTGTFVVKMLQQGVAGSMIGVRLGLSDHIKDANDIFSLAIDEDDMNSILQVSRKGKDLIKVIGDCGDEYRR